MAWEGGKLTGEYPWERTGQRAHCGAV